MKDDKKTMIINFGCVDLSDPELIEKFRIQKLQSDRVEELLKNHIWHYLISFNNIRMILRVFSLTELQNNSVKN